ncbi:MAG TPA: tetratricopeptide repeat protein [Verrucomicrobiae bacterium]|nr:tetratricopeptide repeat protein [Verrucomicrobiae bacterium]
MGEIIEFPGQRPKFGFKRVSKRSKAGDHPAQLDLFSQPTAQILDLASALGTFGQALLWDERGDAKAGELYRKAIEEGDCVADAYCNLGIIESQQANTGRAFDCFTTSLKHNPRHFEAHYNLGNLYFDSNDFRLAQLHYELASEVDPSFPNVYFNLALVRAINNDLAAAVSALTKYQQLVSPEEGRNAEDLLNNLKRALASGKNSQVGPA